MKVYVDGAPKAAETALAATVSVAVPLPALPRTAEGEADWTQTIHQKAKDAREFLSQCTPSYCSGEGDLDKELLVDCYGGGSLEFSKVIAEWRHDGQMKSLVLL